MKITQRLTQQIEELEDKVAELERKFDELSKPLDRPMDRPKKIIGRGHYEFCWSDTNDGYEIVEWDTEFRTCIVIAFFDKKGEGYDMRTVGSRFTDADYDAFELAQMAFDWLAEHEGGDDDDHA
jgi:hypothetical protein